MVPMGTSPDDLSEALSRRSAGDEPAMTRMVDEGRRLPVESGTRAVVRGRPVWPVDELRVELPEGEYAGRVGYLPDGLASFGRP
jgi:hypothetical protein